MLFRLSSVTCAWPALATVTGLAPWPVTALPASIATASTSKTKSLLVEVNTSWAPVTPEETVTLLLTVTPILSPASIWRLSSPRTDVQFWFTVRLRTVAVSGSVEATTRSRSAPAMLASVSLAPAVWL